MGLLRTAIGHHLALLHRGGQRGRPGSTKPGWALPPFPRRASVQQAGHAHLGADAKCREHRRIHRRVHVGLAHGHKRQHVERTHSGVHACLVAQIDEVTGSDGQGNPRINQRQRRSGKGDDHPVVVSIGMHVEHIHTRNGRRRHEPIDQVGAAALATVGHGHEGGVLPPRQSPRGCPGRRRGHRHITTHRGRFCARFSGCSHFSGHTSGRSPLRPLPRWH